MKRKIFTGVSSLAAVGLMFLGTGCSSESSSGADHSSLAFSHDHSSSQFRDQCLDYGYFEMDACMMEYDNFNYCNQVQAFVTECDAYDDSVAAARPVVTPAETDCNLTGTCAPATPQIPVVQPTVKYSSFVDSRDGNQYDVYFIRSKAWMAENLKYVVDDSFCYDGKESNCEIYGRLYTWPAAMDVATNGCRDGRVCGVAQPVRGICPENWVLPDSAAWKSLAKATSSQIKDLKIQKAGYTCDMCSSYDLGIGARLWSSTEAGQYYAYRATFYSSKFEAPHVDWDDLKTAALSVRCVMDSARFVALYQ